MSEIDYDSVIADYADSCSALQSDNDALRKELAAEHRLLIEARHTSQQERHQVKMLENSLATKSIELAEVKAALARTQDASLWWDQYNLEVRKRADTKAALEAANARIAELETKPHAIIGTFVKGLNAKLADEYTAAVDRAERAEAEADSLRTTIDNMRAMNIKLTFEETGKVLAAEAECEAECEALWEKLDALHQLYEHALTMIETRAALNPSPAGEKT